MSQWLGSGVVQANGKAEIDITPNNPAVKWIIKQVGVENLNFASAATTVTLYHNGYILAPSAFLTPTPNGLAASASGEPYTELAYSETLSVMLQGATLGDVIRVNAEYDEVFL